MRKKFEEYRSLFLKARKEHNWNEVILYTTELLQFDSTLSFVWANRGIALTKLGYHVDAILNYDKALEFEKDNEERAGLYSNKGASYWDLWNFDEATKSLERALSLFPLAQTYLTLGNIYRAQNKLDKAIQSLRKAIKLNHEYPEAHLVLGMMLLKAGNLEEGWKEFEWRFKTDQLPSRKFKYPYWAGEDLTNKIILVCCEQGLGDTIQFARYIRILSEKFPGCKIIVEGRHQLTRLLETMPGIYAQINVGEKLPHADYYIPLLSLAGLFTPTISSIPTFKIEYHLRDSHVEVWKDKFETLHKYVPNGIKVGICWSGMARDGNQAALAVDRVRSTELTTFSPLFKIPNIMWISLQKGPPAEQIKQTISGMVIGDFTEDMHDFYETACAIANCDLVITVDTAVAHVAASIGKETWLLSRWDGCWRWLQDRQDSPWYPSMRIFEQPAPHDWENLMNTVAKELRTRLASSQAA